ncbi:MAG: SRPBCC domain-containing protein [Candidatus Sulfotelmatobacter sp.]
MIYKILGSITLMLALLVLGAWNFHTTVRTERTFNASVADVWRIWNDTDSIKKWWGPKGYTALVVRNDVREGGSYLWAMKSEQGRMFWNTGSYKEVVANKKIVSTMSFSNENGKIIPGSQVSVPGQWPNEITVIVAFSESEGKARVTVTEVGVPLIVYALLKIGWAQQFDKIQLLL